MLSIDGRCKSFDESADGYVRGEGGGVVMIKSLAKAELDGDHIYAIIRGIGTNHGGKTNAIGVTNPKAHADVISDIYRKAKVSADTVSYIEAHGPGTPMGDAIEVHGLKSAFERLNDEDFIRPQENSCGLGSVKSNIGHLEGASGLAGLMKVIASMQHKTLPATVNFKTLNSLIKLKNSPFYVVDKTRPWNSETAPTPLRAGISSYGFGGSNAHILLEEYVAVAVEATKPEGPFIVPLSSKTPEQLKQAAKNLLNVVKDSNDCLQNIAYTLQVGRESLEVRIVFEVQSNEALVEQLEAYVQGQEPQEAQGMAASWMKGAKVNWSLLYSSDAMPKRVSLPTYPFEKLRYWIPT
ncbi:MAG: type I polyketide synthase [Psychrosphaera sp.]|nr:type I polyketide synthase [Psychrosphaera sp.]